jgi:hypothetical protein
MVLAITRRVVVPSALLALALSFALPAPAAAQDAAAASTGLTETNWDGLVRVEARKLDAVYLLPEADFSGYTKVMLDPTQVAFRKNWRRDQNRDSASLSGRISDSDARRILDAARESNDEIVHDAFQEAGFTVVTEAGPDVLRVGTAIVNIDVEAPETMSAGRTTSYTREAGAAMLVVEARDSLSGAILGRAIDADSTGEHGLYVRNRVTNRVDFERMFKEWAETSAEGLRELRALSPVDTAGALAR